MGQRPTAAFVLSLLAGIINMLSGILMIVFLPLLGFPFGFLSELFLVIAIVGIASGIVVVLGSAMLFVRPDQHVAWGVIILVLSIIGGFGSTIGLIFGVIEEPWRSRGSQRLGTRGIRSRRDRPSLGMSPGDAEASLMAPTGTPVVATGRRCQRCGAMVGPVDAFCGACGTIL